MSMYAGLNGTSQEHRVTCIALCIHSMEIHAVYICRYTMNDADVSQYRLQLVVDVFNTGWFTYSDTG